MEYHKIRNVDKKICTSEQLIAYKLALRLDSVYGDNFRVLNCEVARCDAVYQMIDIALRWYLNSYTFNPVYNIDAIISALLGGLELYLDDPIIADSYAEVGAMFPAKYLD